MVSNVAVLAVLVVSYGEQCVLAVLRVSYGEQCGCPGCPYGELW